MLESDNVDKFSGETDTETNNTESNTETEEEIENEEDQRCLTPSNTYLELSFEHRGAGSPLNLGAIPKVNNLYKDLVHHSTPNNNGMRFRHLTPNRPLIQLWCARSKLNMDEICSLNIHL